jgi:hypothetical protein
MHPHGVATFLLAPTACGIAGRSLQALCAWEPGEPLLPGSLASRGPSLSPPAFEALWTNRLPHLVDLPMQAHLRRHGPGKDWLQKKRILAGASTLMGIAPRCSCFSCSSAQGSRRLDILVKPALLCLSRFSSPSYHSHTIARKIAAAAASSK